MILSMVLIGSGVGAIAGALFGVVIHLVGRVRSLERDAHGHPTVPMPSPFAGKETVERLERRVEAQARYLRLCTTVAKSTTDDMYAVVDWHGKRIAKLDRAGHRHEGQPRT